MATKQKKVKRQMSKKVEKKDASAVKTAKKGTVKNEPKKPTEKKVAKSEKVEVDVSIKELQGLAQFALHARFLLATLVPPQKNGSRGEMIMKRIDESGPILRDLATRLGVKIEDDKKPSNEFKKPCKCKCEKKPDVKKPVAKKAPAKKPVAKAVAKPVKK